MAAGKPMPGYVYDDPDDPNSLIQGDLIQVDGNFKKLFTEYYPAIKHPDHQKSYALVLSQSCDLVRRKSKSGFSSPKSPHVMVCIVRPITSSLQKELYFRGVNPT